MQWLFGRRPQRRVVTVRSTMSIPEDREHAKRIVEMEERERKVENRLDALEWLANTLRIDDEQERDDAPR